MSVADMRDFRRIPGVGLSLAQDLADLGIRRVTDSHRCSPERLYQRLCTLRGAHIDRCVLYVFRCAVYFASEPHPDPERLKWWNWKDSKTVQRQHSGEVMKASPIIFTLLIVCILSAPVHGQNMPSQIRLERALENARSITNVEIHYEDMLWTKGKPISAAESNDFTRTMHVSYPFSEDSTRTMHVTYIAAEGKYRTECGNVAYRLRIAILYLS